MADQNGTTFNQYSVITAKLAELDRKIDKLDLQISNILDDHEQRLRQVETRIILTISLGLGVLVASVIITWLIARGAF